MAAKWNESGVYCLDISLIILLLIKTFARDGFDNPEKVLEKSFQNIRICKDFQRSFANESLQYFALFYVH